MSLNTEQQQAVDSDNHTLVVAPPGAGKTKLSVDKIARLLAQYPRSKVGAVTFTRDSARELKERVDRVVGAEVADARVIIGTFHALAIKQMKTSKKKIILLSPQEQRSMIIRALQSLGETSVSFEDAIRMIESTKTSVDLTSETLVAERLFNAYQSMLKTHGACDMQDLIRLSLEGMRDNTISPLDVQFLIIDEYQDTDQIQYLWAMEHAKAGAIITVVGDDDQSIYGWRHALGYGGMMQFRDALSATQVTLSSNYRCKAEILSYAKELIGKNVDRVSKNLIAERGSGGVVQCVEAVSREDEGAKLAQFILSLPGRWHEDDGVRTWKVQAKSTAVLARSNILLRLIANELDAEQIDYQLSGGKDIWSMPPLSYLVNVLDGFNKNSSLGIELTLSWMEYPESVIAHVHEHSGGKIGGFKKIPPLTKESDLDKKALEKLNELFSLVLGWRQQLKAGRLQLVIYAVAQWISSGPLARKDAENLSIGTRILADRIKGTLGERLRFITKKKEKQDGDEERVKLMTMHGSKGLEFENVWVMAADEELMPSQPKDGTPAPIEEERRLLYVAMTRAKSRLVVSYAVKPSFFLRESGLLKLVQKTKQ